MKRKAFLIAGAISLLSIIGGFLNSFHYVEGFLVWGVANISWIAYCIWRKEYGQIILWAVYLLQCCIGWFTWGNK